MSMKSWIPCQYSYKPTCYMAERRKIKYATGHPQMIAPKSTVSVRDGHFVAIIWGWPVAFLQSKMPVLSKQTKETYPVRIQLFQRPVWFLSRLQILAPRSNRPKALCMNSVDPHTTVKIRLSLSAVQWKTTMMMFLVCDFGPWLPTMRRQLREAK